MSQSSLLKSKRFAPVFATQFCGAFNDNIFKNCLLLIITYHAADKIGLDTTLVLNIAAGLFILPFFIFSALAGQITDKYDKAILMRRIKFIEVVLMVIAAIAFVFELYYVLLGLLFLMGVQSTFFGPAKYAILPQHLKDTELVGGNALIEMGTFAAILTGTIGAGIIVQLPNPSLVSAAVVVVFAALGYWFSRSIPNAPAPESTIKINYNLFTSTWGMVRLIKQDRPTYLAIMAISWFWFLGAAYLTQFPNFSKVTLAGDESVVTLLLGVFTFGIGAGSLLCEKLSSSHVELGIVPLGAIGLSYFGIDLYFAVQAFGTDILSWSMFFSGEVSPRLLIDLFGIGLFGGIFIVPLYAYVQYRAEEEVRARTIAVINIVNALFMVVSAISAIVFLSVFGLSIEEFFLVLSIMNFVVCLYIFSQVSDFFARFMVWIFSHTMYRVKHIDLEHIPRKGAAVLVCNHVTYMDALLIAGASPRPIRFVIDNRIFSFPVMKHFFKTVKAIPIAPQHQNQAVYDAAMASVSEALQNDELVCIFPEGKLTKDGEMDTFRKGIETVIGKDPVPVIPMALTGLWGSFFSHKDKAALTKRPKRFWSRVSIIASQQVPASEVQAADLESKVSKLLKSAT